MKAEVQNLVKIGKVIDAKGLKGELKIWVFSGEAAWNKKAKVIYLRKAEGDVSQLFHLVSIREENGKFIFQLRDLTTRDAAEALKGYEVFVEEEVFNTKKGESIYLRELLGFTVMVENRAVGEVIGIESNVAQDLVEVRLHPEALGYGGEMKAKGTALVPLVKEFIKKIDHKSRVLQMELPEGLLAANLVAEQKSDDDSE